MLRDFVRGLPQSAPKGRWVCPKPFNDLTLNANSGHPCCYDWLSSYGKKVIPLLQEGPGIVESIWNSEELHKLRDSVYKGEYSCCNMESCPIYLSKEKVKSYSGPTHPDKPQEVIYSVDTTCNLKCPSCGSHLIPESPYKGKRLLEEIMRLGTQRITLSGSGEFFYSKDLLEFFNNLREEDAPFLEKISLITNATLFSRDRYYKLSEYTRKRLKAVSLSLDSLVPEIYAEIRKGGYLPRTMENVEFIHKLHEEGVLNHVSISMVVQRKNYSEIPEFIKFAKNLGCCEVHFFEIIHRNRSLPKEVFKKEYALSLEELEKARRYIEEGHKIIRIFSNV